MANLDEIVDRIREEAGAEFAFVLTRRGRLVTKAAPRDMPEAGRLRLVDAARPLLGTFKVDQITMAREEIVPFGGAAPIDVYFGVAAEQAIVCVVMSTWADAAPVGPAIVTAMEEIAPMLATRYATNSPGQRSQKRATQGSGQAGRKPPPLPGRKPTPAPGRKPTPAPGRKPTPAPGRKLTPAPSAPKTLPAPSGRSTLPSAEEAAAEARRRTTAKARRTLSGLVTVAGPSTRATLPFDQSPLIHEAPLPTQRGASMPEISIGEAPLGRESLAAIEHEGGAFIGLGPRGSSMPEISVGEALLGRESLAAIDPGYRPPVTSIPEITISETVLGRESLAAIDASHRAPLTSMPEQIRVELVSIPDADLRLGPAPESAPITQPYVESATAAKRYGDAARLARKVAPPAIRLRLDSIDEEVIEAALVEPLGGPFSEPSPRATHPWDEPPIDSPVPSPRATNPWDEPPTDRDSSLPQLGHKRSDTKGQGRR